MENNDLLVLLNALSVEQKFPKQDSVEGCSINSDLRRMSPEVRIRQKLTSKTRLDGLTQPGISKIEIQSCLPEETSYYYF